MNRSTPRSSVGTSRPSMRPSCRFHGAPLKQSRARTLGRLRPPIGLVPRPRPDGLRRSPGATRSRRASRLALPLGRRLQQHPVVHQRLRRKRRDALSRAGRRLAVRARVNVNDALSLTEEQRLAAGRAGNRNHARYRSRHAAHRADRPALGRIHEPHRPRPFAVALRRRVGAGRVAPVRASGWKSTWATNRAAVFFAIGWS